MACFITPLITGIVIAVLNKLRSWKNSRLDLLAIMLLGGSILLIAEHAWHGEIVSYPPYFTALGETYDPMVIFHELGLVGGSMTAVTVASWYVLINTLRIPGLWVKIPVERELLPGTR